MTGYIPTEDDLRAAWALLVANVQGDEQAFEALMQAEGIAYGLLVVLDSFLNDKARELGVTPAWIAMRMQAEGLVRLRQERAS